LFETALKYYPDFDEAQIGLGRVLTALGKPELALTHLQKVISLNPTNRVAFYLLSQTYKSLGNIREQQKALAEFRRLQSQQESHQAEMISGSGVTKQELESPAKP
jgi:predicted Zn-dependent protease